MNDEDKTPAVVMKAIHAFVEAANAMKSAHYDESDYPDHIRDCFRLDAPGRRFVRVVSQAKHPGKHSGRSVYVFIELSTGDVYKPAGWKGPAKHVRSNVLAADCGLSGVGVYSARYLR